MRWTAPERHQSARMRLSTISSKEAVRDRDYPHRGGYVEECFPAARGGCPGAGGAAAEAAAAGRAGVLCPAGADPGGAGSVRRVALLGPRTERPGPSGGTDPAAIREALCAARQARRGGRRGDLRGDEPAAGAAASGADQECRGPG